MRRIAILFFVIGIGLLVCGTPQGHAAQKKGTAAAASVQEKMTVEFDYTLTVDGAVVDSSKRQAPLKYVHGQGQIIPGLERELAGLHVGDSKKVTVKPQDAYGEVNPAARLEVPRKDLPQETEPQVGMVLGGRDPGGRPFQAKISAVNPETVTLDMNHPLAGKTLNFDVKIVSITPPSPEK